MGAPSTYCCVSMTTPIRNYMFCNLFVIIFVLLAIPINSYTCMLFLSMIRLFQSLPHYFATCLSVSHINYSLSFFTSVYPAYLLLCINVLSVRNGFTILDTNPLFHSLYLHMYLQALTIALFDRNLAERQFNSPAVSDLLLYNVL